jgi:hypothetical protein
MAPLSRESLAREQTPRKFELGMRASVAGSARIHPDGRQVGDYPETGFEEIGSRARSAATLLRTGLMES